MKFKNPQNGYVEEVSDVTWLWCLLFGVFYFAFKGIWIHFVIGFGAALLTWGISWLIYPFFARSIVIGHYQRNGWQQVDESQGYVSTGSNGGNLSKAVEDGTRIAGFWQDDRDLKAANYKIHLSEKYDIKKNELFEKYVCLDEMFDTIDEALAHADKADRERQEEMQEQETARRNTVVKEGTIGPRKQFRFEELASGEVVVSHPGGVSKRFKSLRLAEIYFYGFLTVKDALIDMEKDK